MPSLTSWHLESKLSSGVSFSLYTPIIGISRMYYSIVLSSSSVNSMNSFLTLASIVFSDALRAMIASFLETLVASMTSSTNPALRRSSESGSVWGGSWSLAANAYALAFSSFYSYICSWLISHGLTLFWVSFFKKWISPKVFLFINASKSCSNLSCASLLVLNSNSSLSLWLLCDYVSSSDFGISYFC